MVVYLYLMELPWNPGKPWPTLASKTRNEKRETRRYTPRVLTPRPQFNPRILFKCASASLGVYCQAFLSGRFPTQAVVTGLWHVKSLEMQDLPHGFDFSGLQYRVQSAASALTPWSKTAATKRFLKTCFIVPPIFMGLRPVVVCSLYH